jgi:hypothetical protein
MKHKVSELSGPLLDLAVAMAEGYPARIERGACYATITQMDAICGNWTPFLPSTDWAQGGSILDRNDIGIEPDWYSRSQGGLPWRGIKEGWVRGSNALEAGLRAYVAWKLGEEIELPESEAHDPTPHRRVAEAMAKTEACGHLSVIEIERRLRETWPDPATFEAKIRKLDEMAQEITPDYPGLLGQPIDPETSHA